MIRRYLAVPLLVGAAGSAVVADRWGLAAFCIVAAVPLLPDYQPFRLRYKARSWAGLKMVYPIASLSPDSTVDKDESLQRAETGIKAMCAAIEPCLQVELLLASGFRVIGWARHQGWLYDVLSKNQGRKLKVLLLDPESESAERRAAEVMGPHGHAAYVAGTQAVLWTLRRWEYEHGLDIEVRLYQEDPIWQMVRLPSELWLLVAAGGRSTDTSPLYALERGTEYGIAWGVEEVFDRRWSHLTTKTVDLSTVQEPNPKDVIALF